MSTYLDGALISPGFPEMLALTSVDAARRGCIVGLPAKNVARLHRSTLAQWARVSVHVAAGLRLSRKLSALQTAEQNTATADAILTPAGRVEHAGGAATSRTARESLKDGAKAMQRARGPLRRRDPSEAIEVWRGLVSGLWSLVGHFDTDGRRYLVAHRNDPTTPDPRALTERERQVVACAQPPRNLEIDVVWIDGEELVVLSHPVDEPAPLDGLSDAERQVAGDILGGLSNEQIAGRRGTAPRTVAKQVAAIFRKVGVGSRREFAAAMRETCGDRPSPTSDRRNSSR